MELTIGKKTYPLYFGLKFIREMDKRYTLKRDGIEFGFGVTSAVVYIEDRNPVILFDLIQAATITEKSKPSVDEIENLLEDEKTDLEKLFKDFLSALETAPLTKVKLQDLKKQAK